VTLGVAPFSAVMAFIHLKLPNGGSDWREVKPHSNNTCLGRNHTRAIRFKMKSLNSGARTLASKHNLPRLKPLLMSKKKSHRC
jgi:hypothetical protein